MRGKTDTISRNFRTPAWPVEMQKPLRSRRADPGRNQGAAGTRTAPVPGSAERTNRTFVCAVLFLDIVDYFKKPVSEQLKIKEQFTARIAEAIREVFVDHRIILDTGDGVAINFLDDPEDALFVALRLARDFALAPQSDARVEVRIGVNLGPVRLIRDGNGQPNLIGDGINVAERVMSFAGTGQVLVSRAYYELVTRACEDYAPLFAYQGSRTDKHVREHEIYEVTGSPIEALDLAARRRQSRSVGRPGLGGQTERTQAVGASLPARWLANRALAYGAATLSVAILLTAVAFQMSELGDRAVPNAPRPVIAKPVKPPEPPPPPVVAEAPPAVLPATPEPAKPASPHPARKESSARKPHHAEAKVHKPSLPKRAAPAARTERAATPEAPTPAKAAVVEERPLFPVASAPKAPPGPTALVMFAISPWGEIFLDGKSAGVSPPLSELELAPGHHRIEIRNGNFKPYLETFELEANQTVRIKYKFKER
jgi:class 3 adenylate cyclase